MTSIIGIKCEKGLEGVVVFSDRCAIQTRFVQDSPETGHYERRRTRGKKLFEDEKGEIVIGVSGQTMLYEYPEFLSKILKDSSPIRKAIRKTTKINCLEELKKLNSHLEQSDVNPQFIRMLIATRYNNSPRLFQCNEKGEILEVPYLVLGSGAGLMFEYIKKYHSPSIPSRTSISEGIRLGYGCMQEAYRDPFTSGIDLYIITAKKIDKRGKRIRTAIRHAKRDEIAKTMNEYKPLHPK